MTIRGAKTCQAGVSMGVAGRLAIEAYLILRLLFEALDGLSRRNNNLQVYMLFNRNNNLGAAVWLKSLSQLRIDIITLMRRWDPVGGSETARPGSPPLEMLGRGKLHVPPGINMSHPVTT